MTQTVKTPSQVAAETTLHFGPFRLEGPRRLWREEHLAGVRPRPLAVLRYLAERPGRLVASEELLNRLWPGIYVTKTVLRVCVREVRQALAEGPVAPRFIETVGRQGYRFIAPIATTPPVFSSQSSVPSSESEDGMQQLPTGNCQLLSSAGHGERQIMFLFGESGIGKTTLVDRFLEQILPGAGDWRQGTSFSSLPAPGVAAQAPSLRIGRGQCVEHYGGGEAYLPLLEALGQVCEGPGGEQVMAVLRRHAPLWLAQFAGLLEADEREAVRQSGPGSSQERMVRELAEAIEVLAADTVLILVLEDLQWSDTSTLDALAYLAQRRRQVRLYIVGTYRPAEVVVSGHRLRQVVQELYGRRQCEELALELLTEADVQEYLRRRFGRGAAVTELSQLIYEQIGEARRVRVHRQLGEWKAERYGERTAEIAGELAVHFTTGPDYRRAVQYYGQVSEVALRRSAYREASDHCRKGLDLLERLPDTPERQRQELALRMILSVALTAIEGYEAEGLVRNLTRARDLCQALNDDGSLVSVLVGLGRFYDLRADLDAIEQLMDEERRLLTRIQEPLLAIQLHTHLGTSSMVRGALVQAQEHHARVLELYNPRWHSEFVLRFSMDPAVIISGISSWGLWLAGWPDQACARLQHGLHWGKELDHRFSLIVTLINAARVHLWCGNLDDAERLTEEGVGLAREHNVAWFIRAGGMLQGCIQVQQGKTEAGLALLTETVAQYRSAGVRYLLPLHLSSVVDAYWRLGRVDEGLATVTEALHLSETSTTSFWAAEVHRLKGELTLSQSRGQRQKEAKIQGPKFKIPSL
ncbi:MAG: AAA family ATPase [Deltaproteobacteria bacterium]|nr:AAA family ATPase [Deltaproteobacteria bacterium]